MSKTEPDRITGSPVLVRTYSWVGYLIFGGKSLLHGMKMARLAMDSYGARTGENEFETSIAEIDRILKEVGAV